MGGIDLYSVNNLPCIFFWKRSRRILVDLKSESHNSEERNWGLGTLSKRRAINHPFNERASMPTAKGMPSRRKLSCPTDPPPTDRSQGARRVWDGRKSVRQRDKEGIRDVSKRGDRRLRGQAFAWKTGGNAEVWGASQHGEGVHGVRHKRSPESFQEPVTIGRGPPKGAGNGLWFGRKNLDRELLLQRTQNTNPAAIASRRRHVRHQY
jgi:hypothetical protein